MSKRSFMFKRKSLVMEGSVSRTAAVSLTKFGLLPKQTFRFRLDVRRREPATQPGRLPGTPHEVD